MIYSTCKINVCTDFEINRFRIDVMWRKNATSCVMGTTTLLIDILTRNILKPTRSLYDFRFRSYGSNSGFRVFGDLDLDLWHMFFFLSHALRIMYWNIHAKFIRIRSVILGDMPWTHTHTHTHTHIHTHTHTHTEGHSNSLTKCSTKNMITKYMYIKISGWHKKCKHLFPLWSFKKITDKHGNYKKRHGTEL